MSYELYEQNGVNTWFYYWLSTIIKTTRKTLKITYLMTVINRISIGIKSIIGRTQW